MDASISPAQDFLNVDCPHGPFETDIEKISHTFHQDTPSVRSQQEANLVVPIEISRILEGGISFFQGGLINEGKTTWYAFDVERRLFVAVLASTGNNIPAVEKLNDNQLLRYTDAAGYRRAEFVTVIGAAPAQVREFSCMANQLLGNESETVSRPTPEDTITKTFSLMHNGKILDLGEGRKRCEIKGKLVHFIGQPLQEPILRAY